MKTCEARSHMWGSVAANRIEVAQQEIKAFCT
jgi:hypothetical protein